MQKLDKIKEVKVAEQSIEVDPRSKTTADGAFNYIATGKPEMPVGGQKRMLAEKKQKSGQKDNTHHKGKNKKDKRLVLPSELLFLTNEQMIFFQTV